MTDVARPFTTFNFKVNLQLAEESAFICEATFSECDGLEMTLAPKTIREGGNNVRQIHLTGPISYGQLSLKRGMTHNFGLWDWFEQVQKEPALRAFGDIIILPSERASQDNSTNVRFKITGCLPVKLKAPALNAKEGLIAIEEMQIAYETLHRVRV